MKRRLIHIIVCFLLTALFVVERALPCMDMCGSESAPSAAGHELSDEHSDHHDEPSSTGGAHHCSHCVCPCHIPAIAGGGDIPDLPDPGSARRIPFEQHPPSAATDPLDHVPLV